MIEAGAAPRPLMVQSPIIVKTYDIDYAQIVHNAVYIRWLEDLRSLILADHYPIEQMIADSLTPILTRTEIDYRLPVRFGDQLTGRIWVSDLGRTKWTIQAEFIVSEQLHTQATQFGFFASLETLRPTRVPAVLKERWLAGRV